MKTLKIAAMGDIHSNDAALEAAIAAARELGCEAFLFLGDYVSDCARPGLTLDRLYRLSKEADCRFILGNREKYMLDHLRGVGGWREGTGGGSLLYTSRRLRDGDIRWMASLPAVRREVFASFAPILMCHGSPDDIRGWAAEETDRLEAWLSDYNAGVMLCAHTHRPRVVSLSGGGLVVNAGSVGLPGEAGLAEFALLTGENGAWRAEIARAPYDPEKAIARFYEDGFMEEAGLWPYMVMKQLRRGGDWGSAFVERAYSLWEGQGVPPEEIWRRAARELGIGTDSGE